MAGNQFGWLYETDTTGLCRFVLGKQGKNPLICFGLNPSTAEPGKLDPTMQSVARLTKNNGYDSWIMINLYPKRVTNPKNLPRHLNQTYHKENLKHIKSLLNPEGNQIWAAWGTIIEVRPYFYYCLTDILKLSKSYPISWVHCGSLTKKGHPRHPLYVKSSEKLYEFDIEKYLLNF